MENYEKKYKKALRKATKIHRDDNKEIKHYMEVLFPELVESEDERIRKQLIDLIYKVYANTSYITCAEHEEMLAWLEKQGEQKPIINVPPREVILSIWDLGNEWKELTNGCFSAEYGTQLDYIQKHWHESEYYLKEKQGVTSKKVTCTQEVEIGNGNIKALVTEEMPVDKIESKFHEDEKLTDDCNFQYIIDMIERYSKYCWNDKFSNDILNWFKSLKNRIK